MRNIWKRTKKDEVQGGDTDLGKTPEVIAHGQVVSVDKEMAAWSTEKMFSSEENY